MRKLLQATLVYKKCSGVAQPLLIQEKPEKTMTFLFWGLATAMLIVAISFIAMPLITGKSLLATPKAIILTFIPLSAMGLYALLGSPAENTVPHIATNSAPGAAADRSLGSVASMVDGLAARLDDQPNDAEGWILLARSYQHIDRHAEALDAYKHAQALGRTDLDLEAKLLGDSLSGQVVTQPVGPSLRGRVALSPAAAALVQPGDTLFIFAKESPEHRMPVVALRKSVSDLPFEFVLTDKEVMVPGSQLNDFEQLVVTAKISRSGNATDNSLGLEAWSDAVSPSSTDRIDLLIGDADE
jgi:cytochrome c-type biogenesis protein CcmH